MVCNEPTETILINQITKESIEKGKTLYICKASLGNYQDIISYQGCKKCSKKITAEKDEYNCMFCKTVSKTSETKFMVKIRILDESKQIWLTLFENQIKQLVQQEKLDINKLEQLIEKQKNKEFCFT